VTKSAFDKIKEGLDDVKAYLEGFADNPAMAFTSRTGWT